MASPATPRQPLLSVQRAHDRAQNIVDGVNAWFNRVFPVVEQTADADAKRSGNKRGGGGGEEEDDDDDEEEEEEEEEEQEEEELPPLPGWVLPSVILVLWLALYYIYVYRHSEGEFSVSAVFELYLEWLGRNEVFYMLAGIASVMFVVTCIILVGLIPTKRLVFAFLALQVGFLFYSWSEPRWISRLTSIDIPPLIYPFLIFILGTVVQFSSLLILTKGGETFVNQYESHQLAVAQAKAEKAKRIAESKARRNLKRARRNVGEVAVSN